MSIIQERMSDGTCASSAIAGASAQRPKLNVLRPTEGEWIRADLRRWDATAGRTVRRIERNLRTVKPAPKSLVRLYQKSQSDFCHTLLHSKMLLLRSGPTPSLIRCTLWRVCFLKSPNATRFVS